MSTPAIPPFKIKKPKKPKRPAKTVTTIYMPEDLIEKLDRAGEKANRSRSAEVVHRLNKSFGKDDG